MDILSLGHILGDWWPLIFIIVGVIKLQRGERKGGLGLFLGGLVFLSVTLEVINWSQVVQFWPLILVAIGISLILKRRGIKLSAHTASAKDDEIIRAHALFGGISQRFTVPALKHGEVSAIFGGVEIDLADTSAAAEEVTFDVTVLFGGAEIRVPRNWDVRVKGTPILGGIESNVLPREQLEGEKFPVVTFYCTVGFGGIEIKH
ncbi:MAG: cell wall-active antibiotics response protein [Candidatus Marinimicrobia bacterium]|nr:cell wall-active antibiotics response protein [Candidatus Neomarinimicrobiota bacterium]MCF7827903.1 cell wall-active antibiotics response protein [Candidatus Neomarinimicrobiota bacterium]MCF7879342.1 cell wall-active antibiotics response protein [Candidatus Neomarinimicrobiota bacterium]